MKKKFLTLLLLALINLSITAQDLIPMHNDKGRFGYGIKGSKELVIKAQWDEARPFNEYGVAIVRKGLKYGFINKQGKPIGKAMGYSLIAQFDGQDMWLVALGGKRVNSNNEIKTRAGLSPYGFKGSLCYLIGNAKWGLIGKDGKEIVKPIYNELSNVNEAGMIIFQNRKKLFGYLNLDGKVILDAKYDCVTPFNKQKIAAVRNAKKSIWSLVNNDGKVIIGEDKKIICFRQFMNDYWGSVNTIDADSVLKNKSLCVNGERILPIMSSGLSWINSNHPYIAAYTTSGKGKKKKILFGVYDLDGKQVISFDEGIYYSYVPSEGVAVVERDKEQYCFYGIDDKSITVVEKRTYLPFKKGFSLSYDSNMGGAANFYMVNRAGEKVSDTYDEVTVAQDRFIVRKGNQYSLITQQGKKVIPLNNLSVMEAGNDIFAVKNQNGEFGYVNSNGETVIPFDYTYGSTFFDGYAVVAKINEENNREVKGIINQRNEVVVPIAYEKAFACTDNNGKLKVWVSNGNTLSEYDVETNNLKPTSFVDMKYTNDYIVTKNENGNCGLYKNGKEVIPCCINNEELLGNLYEFMLSNNINTISTIDALTVSKWFNNNRNNFKLSDKINNNIWDF